MHDALNKMEELKREGKLDEYLKEPNFLYALISHPGMTLAKTQSLILDLFVGGIDSVSKHIFLKKIIRVFFSFLEIVLISSAL